MEINTKTKNYNINPAPPNQDQISPSVTPEYPTLIVMIAVLAIILLFCFWGAPGVRDYCKRSICSHCRRNNRQRNNAEREADDEDFVVVTDVDDSRADDESVTPTIILLPFGRMLVVDRNVFTQLQADQTGIDFMELSANLIRAHHLQYGSTPSILDSDATSKGLSPISLGFSPPSYEDIFGEKNFDLPPSYSELSLSFRQRQNDLSGINDINENEHHFHNGINSVTKISRGNRAIESGEEEVDESICEIIPNENNSEMNSQIKFQIQFGGNISTVPSINSIEIRNNLQENDDQESTTKINTEETFDKIPENCQCCVMTYENERNGNDKCVCCKSLVTGANVLHHVGNSNSNVYTDESDEVVRISVDKEINTQDGACCSHGNSIGNQNATGLYSVNSNVRSNKVGKRFDNQTATYHAKLAIDKKSDSTAIKIQKCKDIKESSL